MNSPHGPCPMHLARIHTSSACIFLILLVVGNASMAAAADNSAPPFHQNVSISDSTRGIDSQQASFASESHPLKRKKSPLKSNMTCAPLSNDLFDAKLKQKKCKRLKKSSSASPRMGMHVFKAGSELQSKVPHWLNLIRKKNREPSANATKDLEAATFSTATSVSALNVSRIADANVSAPDEGKVEERKPTMSLEKVRMDVLGRLEDEQQQQQQQQQQQTVHGSANRSSSIPLIHRSNEESITKGVNYASAALGAKIVSSNVEGKHAVALLLSEEERYWMSPCSANRSVVIELAESVLVQSITLMHNEYYSSISRAVLLQGAQIMPTDRWTTLGLLAVENIRGAQAYSIPSPVELRYLSLQMHGSYGKETFCTMSGVQVFGKAAMGIIEQEIDREAHLAMRSYADVQAEILKSLDPYPVPATAAALAPVETSDMAEASEVDFAELSSVTSERFQWEISRQQAQNFASKAVPSFNITVTSATNSSAEGAERLRQDEDLAASLPPKSMPSSASSIAGSLPAAAAGEESQHLSSTSSAGAGDGVIAKDVVASVAVGAAAMRGDVDTPKIQLDSNIIRKLWNKLRDLVPANSNTGLLPPLTLRSGVQPQRGQWLCECKCAARRPHDAKIIEHGQVLSKKHEEQLLHLAVSTASLDISLQAVRNSSACQCPDVSALQRSLDAAATRITELEAAAASRLSELDAAAARLKALESKVSHLWAAAAPPPDPK